ncbi:hypothetical protein PCE1_002164 [Barthelona sp. PCE]
MTETRTVRIVHAGCVHGHFEELYDDVAALEKLHGPIDCVVITGDAQTFRSPEDLEGFAAPRKYHQLGTFHKFKDNAPYPTLFVGGNHEAYNWLLDHTDGGEIAPNIHYMGRCGGYLLKGVRFVGVSGIYNKRSYDKPLTEKAPLNRSNLKSVYHVRRWHELAMSTYAGILNLEGQKTDIFMTHDWPKWVQGRKATNLNEDVRACRLENTITSRLHRLFEPDYALAAHMHYVHSSQHRRLGIQFEAVTKYRDPVQSQQDRLYNTVKLVEIETTASGPGSLTIDPLWEKTLDVYREFVETVPSLIPEIRPTDISF